MRILKTDNFGMSGEAPGKDEKFVAGGVILDEETATKVVEALNAQFCDWGGAPWFYKVVPDNHELQVFKP